MEEAQDNVSSAIFDITHACLQSFDQVVTDYDELQLTQPLGPSESPPNGNNRRKNTYDFLGLRNSFLFWIDYTGALSLMSSSLDARLQGLEDVSVMVLELLEMVLRNLHRLEQKTETIRPNTWEDASHAIGAALDRLHFIAVAIRKASAKQLGHSVTSFVTEEDIVFRRDIALWVRYRFPATRRGLCQQLGDSIAIRRRILLQTEHHAKKLAVRRVPTKVPPVKQHDSKHLIPQMGQKQQVEARISHHPSVLASGVTKASRPDPHSPALQAIHRPQRRALTTVISTISTSHEDKFEYPPIPRASFGETRIQCPFCLRPLERNETKEDRWRHHIDEHIKPYGCLFPECAESQLFFIHRKQWKSHMESAHSKDWLRKAHTIVWYCDIDHDIPETFETEVQWKEHMLNLESHPNRRLKAPTQAQLDALSPRKQQVAPRDKFVCPLCEQIPEKIRPLVEKGNGDAAAMYDFVVDHVANHLKSLSLMAVPSSDTPTPETPGILGRSDLLRSESSKNSVPQPPSGKEFLDGVSLPAETWGDLGRETVAFAARSSTDWDDEYVDYQWPDDLPEPSMLMWLEDWEAWRSDNDPFPSRDSQLDPILAHLIEAKNTETTNAALPEEVDINEKDETGRTALSFAAGSGDIEAINRLLEKGADPEIADQDGNTPLLWAASEGHTEAVDLLSRKGANIHAADQIYGRTPLSWAASKGHEKVVRLLLRYGAEVDAADNSLRTPLSWAASRGQKDTVRLLLECGANLESSDPKYGRTPLSWAAARGHHGTIELLRYGGANPETTDREYGRTPLSWAAESGHSRSVKMLLDHGANIDARDRVSSQTPLMLAAENGHLETVRLLLQWGAYSNAKDSQGWTALEWATEEGHDDIATLLNPVKSWIT